MTLDVVGAYYATNDALGHAQDSYTVFIPLDPRPT